MDKEKYEDMISRLLKGDDPGEENLWQICNVLRRISDLASEAMDIWYDNDDDGSGNGCLQITLRAYDGVDMILHTFIGGCEEDEYLAGDCSYTVWNRREMLISDFGWLDDTIEFWRKIEDTLGRLDRVREIGSLFSDCGMGFPLPDDRLMFMELARIDCRSCRIANEGLGWWSATVETDGDMEFYFIFERTKVFSLSIFQGGELITSGSYSNMGETVDKINNIVRKYRERRNGE